MTPAPSVPPTRYPALLKLFDEFDAAQKQLREAEERLDAAIAKWSADNGYLVHLRREAVRQAAERGAA